MAEQRWRGRGAGTAAGLGLAGVTGWLASWPEYINTAPIGLSVGAAAAVLGFAGGTWWDRRAAQLQTKQDQQAAWSQVFSDSPAPVLPGQEADADFGVELLLASSSVVDFERGHLRHVTPIRLWCAERRPGRVWLLAGGPGTGKTRVAMRVVQNLRRHESEPWACGWLRSGPGTAQAALTVASSWPQPVLILVDDADLRLDLPTLLDALHQTGPPAQTVRVVLIAREFGAWWTDVQQALRISVDTAAEHTWVGPVSADTSGQRAATRRAIAAFADRLDVIVDTDHVAVHGIEAGTPALLLQAAALEAVHQISDGYDAPVHVSDAVASLSDRELERRLREAHRQNLTAYPQITTDVLRDTLILATLVGATDPDSTGQLLRHVPGLTGLTPALSRKLTAWLHLYGVATGYHTRPHLPAAIAEHLICDALNGHPALARAVTELATTSEQASYALAVLARAADHTPTASMAASSLISADPYRLLPIAITQAHRGIGSLDHAIATALPAAGLDWQAATTLHEHLDTPQRHLTDSAIALTLLLTHLAPDTASRAHALTEHRDALTEAHRYAAATVPAHKAVSLFRDLAAAAPDRHQPDLALALTGLTSTLGGSGHPGEAVVPAREAVDLYRELAAADPGRHQTDLAHALTSLAKALHMAGHPGEAVVPAREAVDLFRELAAADPGRHQTNLAFALTVLADALREALRMAGHPGEAVVPAREAVDLFRELAAADPGRHQTDLAHALTSLAKALRGPEYLDEAVVPAREAVTLYRELAVIDPYRIQPSLAYALGVLAEALRGAGHPGQAAVPAGEAVDLRRELAAADPDRHETYLALALVYLAEALREAGHPGEAVVPAREAVDLYRELAVADSDRHQPYLAAALAVISATQRDFEALDEHGQQTANDLGRP